MADAPAKPSKRTSAAIWGSAAGLLGVGAALIRSKVVAVRLGPEGSGLTAEALQYATLALTPATLALGPAFLRALATSPRRGPIINQAFALYLLLSAIGVVASVSLVLLTAEQILPSVLIVALIWMLFQNAMGLATQPLLASDRFKSLGIVNIVSAVLVTSGVAVGLLFGGVFEQLAGAAVGAAGAYLIAIWVARGASEGIPRPNQLPTRTFFREAIKTGATGLIAGLAMQGALIATRTAALDAGGPALVGQFQAAWAISTTYFGLLLGGMLGYSFPRFAAASGSGELEAEMNDALRFCGKVVPPLLILAVVLRRETIHVLYDDRFSVAAEILGYQLAGDVLKATSWVLAGPLLVRAQLRAYLVTETVAAISLAALSVVFTRLWGPTGLGLAYLVTYGIYAVVVAVAISRTFGTRTFGKELLFSALFAGLALTLNALTKETSILSSVLVAATLIAIALGPLRAQILTRLRAKSGATD